MINRENYEIFFMDYLDGQLSPEQLEALHLFLDNNPDLKAELEEMSGFKLKPINTSFPDKASLKKTPDLPEINLSNIDTFLLHELEGNLSDEQLKQLNSFLQLHPELKPQRESWLRTKLVADNTLSVDKAPLIAFNGQQDFETTCIAYLEGDLSAEDTTAFEALIEDNETAFVIFTSFQKSQLPAQDIIFENKASLKQSEGRVIPIWWRQAVAVAAILLIGWLVLPDMFDRARTKQTASPLEDTEPGKTDVALDDKQIDSTNSVAPDPLVANDVIIVPDEKEDEINGVKMEQKQNAPAPLPRAVQPSPQNSQASGSDLAETTIELKGVPLKPELLPLDSVLNAPIELELNDDNDNIAMNEAPVSNPNNALSVKEAVAKTISNRVTETPSEYDTDLNYAALNTLGKLTKSDVDYEKGQQSDRSITAFTIGKFGFYRSKKKK